MDKINLKNIVIMKYGVHASEAVDNIIKRKIKEFHEEGKMFWGYGGKTCHPKNQIHPFIELNILNNEKTYLLLTKTTSDFNNQPIKARQYSKDGVHWENIPKRINVFGSKFAIVCGELKKCDYTIDLNKYTVPVGNSKGKILSEYFKRRIDKACGQYLGKNKNDYYKNEVNILYYAEIIEPFAIFIK